MPAGHAVAEDPLALYDARWHGFFRRAFTRFGRRHMRALRLARWGQPDPGPPGTPLVVFANHPAGYLPVQVRRVLATGTSAGQIVALFD